MISKLKLKHRTRKLSKKTKYRARTGPKCCNAGCESTRKKKKKKINRPDTQRGLLG